MTTGQQSKPGVARREFLLSLSWAIRASLVGFFMGLATMLGLAASKELGSSAFKGASQLTDMAKNHPNAPSTIGAACSLIKLSFLTYSRGPGLGVSGLLSTPAAFARFVLFALGYSDSSAPLWGLPWGSLPFEFQKLEFQRWRRLHEMARPRWMYSSTIRRFLRQAFSRNYQVEMDKLRYPYDIVCRFNEGGGVVFGNRAQAKSYGGRDLLRQENPFSGVNPSGDDLSELKLAMMTEGTKDEYKRYTPWRL